jgi:hypothetical protein
MEGGDGGKRWREEMEGRDGGKRRREEEEVLNYDPALAKRQELLTLLLLKVRLSSI